MKHLLSIFLGLTICLPMNATAQILELKTPSAALTVKSSRHYSYNFGQVPINWHRWAEIRLRNNGPDPLIIRGVFITGSTYFSWSDCPPFLAQGQSCNTHVEFRPWREGFFPGRLRFAFSSESIYVDLFGWGVRGP